MILNTAPSSDSAPPFPAATLGDDHPALIRLLEAIAARAAAHIEGMLLGDWEKFAAAEYRFEREIVNVWTAAYAAATGVPDELDYYGGHR